MKRVGLKILGVVVVALSLLYTSCEGLFDELGIDFDSDYVVVEFTIPPVSDTGYYSFPSEEVTTNIDSLLEAKGMTEDDILSVTIKDIILEIKDGAENFDAFSYVEASVLFDSEEMKFAYLDTIPKGVSALDCKYINDDLSPYVMVPEFQLVAGGQVIAPIEEIMTITGKVKFTVQTSVSSALSSLK